MELIVLYTCSSHFIYFSFAVCIMVGLRIHILITLDGQYDSIVPTHFVPHSREQPACTYTNANSEVVIHTVHR